MYTCVIWRPKYTCEPHSIKMKQHSTVNLAPAAAKSPYQSTSDELPGENNVMRWVIFI